MSRGYNGRRDRGVLWTLLPELKSRDLGKLGPAFGYGVGCGAGFGIGLIGGVGIGAGFPGLQFGFGLGAGCGVGIGFGYGAGKGVAYDEYRRYSNVGKLLHRAPRSSSSQDEIDELVNEVLENTRRLLQAASREIDKWRWN
ncbi:Glycine-rich protein [Rhynchospora pubera]|uniref:Uncharacterized protein n=2 Tax=Rhynchospora TaxID=46332 RepID=A0A9Q0D0V5_9POAL|nr:hypothetical protein LUZ63_003555 [Rhynchospora breviuscula]KAJ4733773.1 Glycine-rich protein [Rhynchospora pubera]KAJ4748252.1 Glycine-rich protein [Rhynchospora pubera]KAJ4798781.1 Glycine-rich protein [Rhynchospora pubera]